MALKIRYQTTYEPFKVVDDIKEIPKDATIVWYDFDDRMNKKMNGLKHILILMI